MNTNTVITSKEGFVAAMVTVIIFKEDDSFVAYCPVLELSSYADTEKEAKEAFKEALDIFIEETSRKGTLEKFLLKLGWELKQKPTAEYMQPTMAWGELLNRKTPQNVFDTEVLIPV